MGIRVLIVDDHQMLRAGLRLLLEQQPDVRVVGEAHDGRMGITMAQELLPSIVIMDVSMPGLNGIDATRHLRAAVPEARIIALSAHADKSLIVQMLAAGASGYLLKVSAFDELMAAIRAVDAGLAYLSPRIASLIVSDYLDRRTADTHSAFSQLSSREREILQLFAEGHSARDIAALLSISQKTVDVHRVHIMDKLQLSSLADLVKYALREGLTSLEE